MKFQKASSCSQKRDFITAVLSTIDFDEPTFTKSRKNLQSTERVGEKWVNWEVLKAKEGEQIARLQVKQGKVLRRPHTGLDHSDPEVEQLPEELRSQYLFVQDATEYDKATRFVYGSCGGEAMPELCKTLLAQRADKHANDVWCKVFC